MRAKTRVKINPKAKHAYALKNNNGTRGVLGGSGEFWTKISEKSEKKWNSK